MPDYQEMYLHLMRETEKAIRILIAAQRECEELYLRDGDLRRTSVEGGKTADTARAPETAAPGKRRRS